uniref:Putative secreted protein n=1 Tax=Amblyomma tuberculatum TaxID=48802 RepID=A0A6M2E2C3_9ACAR
MVPQLKHSARLMATRDNRAFSLLSLWQAVLRTGASATPTKTNMPLVPGCLGRERRPPAPSPMAVISQPRSRGAATLLSAPTCRTWCPYRKSCPTGVQAVNADLAGHPPDKTWA